MHAQSIERAVRRIFADSELHAKRVTSLAHAVIGALNADRAGVANIGRFEASARETRAKHAIKQVDRLLSNAGVDIEVAQGDILRFILGNRWKVVVSLDWTDYAASGQHRVALNLVTRHGRATPLAWKTVTSRELSGRRNDHEDELLRRFKRLLPAQIERVVVLADRGFADTKLYDMLTGELGFDYVIRFRKSIKVRDAAGNAKSGGEWVPSNGRALLLENAKVTGDKFDVRSVVAVKRAAMKAEWLLASSLALSAEELVALYGRRFTIEENFRDEKDWRFGLGARYVRIRRADRRDRLCLILAIATVLLTLLGAAGERLGLDRLLRANTVKHRTHSLFRQGREYVRAASRATADQLLDAFWQVARDHHAATEEYGVI
jgi:hypothetical protein